MNAIRNAGGDVVAIISDGNRVNQKFFKMFDRVQPWLTQDKIFLLFDFVHLLKNIRNNWITEPSQELIYILNGESKVAKWSDLKKLYKLESHDGIVKLSQLTDISITPKPIERQRVSYVLQVFHEKTITALKDHTQMQNAEETITFLEIILRFWNIVNVKGPFDDSKLRDPSRAAIRSPDDENHQFLAEVATMVEKWLKKVANLNEKGNFLKILLMHLLILVEGL